MQNEYDIIIVGGGLVGTSLACALAPLKCRIALIEARPLTSLASAALDTRTLALSLGSVQTFSSLNLWDELQLHATPIQQIHVSDRGHFGATRLQADRYQIPAFGYVVRMPELQNALQARRARCEGVTLFCPAEVMNFEAGSDYQTLTITHEGSPLGLKTKLVVAADGADSSLRKILKLTSDARDYGQMAIVTNVGLARSSRNIAYERFTETGPLALLPVGDDQAALIWTLTPESAEEMIQLDDEKFIAKVQDAFGYRAGRFVKVGKRLKYPLKMTISKETIQPGIVFIGNAAQSLHPIAGQGFNLGLRDVMGLTQVLQGAINASRPLNDFTLLETYHRNRASDKSTMIQFTEALTRVFTNPMRSVACVRDLGLMLFDRSPWLQQALVHRAMGLGYVG